MRKNSRGKNEMEHILMTVNDASLLVVNGRKEKAGRTFHHIACNVDIQEELLMFIRYLQLSLGLLLRGICLSHTEIVVLSLRSVYQIKWA